MEEPNKVEEYMVPLYHVELVREKVMSYRSANSVKAAAEIFHEMLDNSPVEKMAIIHCNSGLKMIGAEIVAMGSHEFVGVQFPDLIRGFIKNNAAAMWVAHNHVDGFVKASLPDYKFTVELKKVCDTMHIKLEDHLVITPGEHYSIRDHEQELEEELLVRDPAYLRKRLLDLKDKYPSLGKIIPMPPDALGETWSFKDLFSKQKF